MGALHVTLLFWFGALFWLGGRGEGVHNKSVRIRSSGADATSVVVGGGSATALMDQHVHTHGSVQACSSTFKYGIKGTRGPQVSRMKRQPLRRTRPHDESKEEIEDVVI